MGKPDIEALITILRPEDGGSREHSCATGYRPAHLVKDDYLTTGTHDYYDRDHIDIGESLLGTITFITPEYYPHCLWVGKILRMQEGSKLVGFAKVTKIFNELLKSRENVEKGPH